MKKNIPLPPNNKCSYNRTNQAHHNVLAQAVEQSGDAIFITDPNGVIEYVNPTFELVTGYAKEEVIGQTPRLIRSGKMSKEFQMQFWKTIQSGKTFRAEVINRKKDGEIFYYDQTVSPLTDTQGRITHYISTGKDITKRKQAEQEVQILLHLTRIIAESEDFDTALEGVLRTVCENAGWDYGEVWMLCRTNDCLELGTPYFCANDDLENFRRTSRGFFFAPCNGLPGRVQATGIAAWIQDVASDDNCLRSETARDSGLKAAVGIPILNEGMVVAVMAFFMKEAHNEDERMVAFISAAAAQLGTAFQRKRAENENVILHHELEQSAQALEKRLRESNALSRIAHTLSETERVGLQTVLQQIAVSAKELIPVAGQVVIHLWNKEEQILIPQAVIGFNEAPSGRLKLRPHEGAAGQALASGKTVNIADIEMDEHFVRSKTSPSFRSLLVAPVQIGERKLGTISVQSKTVGAFTEEDSALLGVLGAQAATAIENAHLIETTQQALRETGALYYITRGLANSLHAEQLMKDAVELLKQNFGYYHVHIYMVDAKTGDLVIQQGSGEVGMRLKSLGHSLKAGFGITGYVLKEGKPFLSNAVDEVAFFIRNPLLPDTQSELAVPIKVGQNALGVVDVQQCPPGQLTERDLQLVSAVADQLAVALEKASLYAELQTALAQEKAARQQMIQSERLALTGRLLASVSHELNNPIQAIQNTLFLLREEQGLSSQGRQDLQTILTETERMAELFERLRDTYRPLRAEDFQPVQVNTVVEDICALLAAHLKHKRIRLEFRPQAKLPCVPGLVDQIRQVILNLILNSVDAMPLDGLLTVRTQHLPGQREILLSIQDTGPGIAPEILPHIFEPFVTGKDAGSGLGLTIVHEIILQHNGRIQAENLKDGGALFSVWLPIEKVTEV